jgi:hypothetical protein
LKKGLFLILSIIYFITSTGADLHYHYCMGKLADWSVWSQNDEKKCSKCGMDKNDEGNNGCCKDEHKWFKIEDDQKANFQLESPTLSSTEINQISGCTFSRVLTGISKLHPISNAPPRKNDIAVFILNHNFRI